MKSKKLVSLIVFIIATTVFFTGCGSFNDNKKPEGEGEEETLEAQRFTDTYFDVFDTVTTLIAYCEDQESFDKLTKEAYDSFKYYHRLFDIYNTYEGMNNAKTINNNAGKEAVKVEPEFIELIELSKELYSETGGRVNVAMGSVLSLWHEAREVGLSNPEKAYIPDMAELKEAALHCNIDDIVVDKEAGTVYLNDPEMSIDLGAIAKGFAAEKVAQDLENKGYKSFVLSLGGNVRAVGRKGFTIGDGSSLRKDEEESNFPKWVIAIQNPDTESEIAYVSKVELMDTSLVTSGVYQRYYEVDGRRYHHIIDSETLQPENRFLSLTIQTKDSGIADALSTAVFNMDLEEGKAFVESKEGIEALWILPDESLVASSGWVSYEGE